MLCVWTICRSYEVWWISQTVKYHSDKLFRNWSSETRYFFSFDSRDIRYYFRFAEVSGSEWWRRMFQPSTAATVPQIRCDKISEYMNIEYKMIFTIAKLNKKQRQNISYFMKSHPSILEVSFNQMRNMFWRMFANFQFQLIFKRNCTVKTLFIEKCNIYLSRSVLKPLLLSLPLPEMWRWLLSPAVGWQRRAGEQDQQQRQQHHRGHRGHHQGVIPRLQVSHWHFSHFNERVLNQRRMRRDCVTERVTSNTYFPNPGILRAA